MLAVPLFAEIHARTGFDLPLATLFEAPTVRRMAVVLDAAGSPQERDAGPRRRHDDRVGVAPPPGAWTSLVCLQEGEGLVPFFCAHAIGGNVVNYAQFLPHLDRRQPLYGLQAIGLDGVSPLPPSIEAMAASYVEEILTVQPHGPYLLGGGSMGGLLALEMAQQLQAMDEEVSLVAMFDTEGPNPPILPEGDPGAANGRAGRREHSSTFGAKVRARVGHVLRRWRCDLLRLTNRAIPHDDRYWYLEERHRELMQRYSPRTYRGTITMLRAVPREEGVPYDPEHGWTGVATEGIEVIEVPGEHGSFIEEPEVARQVGLKLRDVQRGHAAGSADTSAPGGP